MQCITPNFEAPISKLKLLTLDFMLLIFIAIEQFIYLEEEATDDDDALQTLMLPLTLSFEATGSSGKAWGLNGRFDPQ